MPSVLALENTYAAREHKKLAGWNQSLKSRLLLEAQLGEIIMFKYLLKTVQFHRNFNLIKAEIGRQSHAQLNYVKKLGVDLASIAIWSAIVAALAFFALPVLLILLFAIISPYIGAISALVILLCALLGGALIVALVAKAKISAIKNPPSLKMPQLKGLSGARFSADDYLTHQNLAWLELAAERPRRRKMDRQSQAILQHLKPRAEALADRATCEIVDRLHNGDPKMKAVILGSAVVAGWLGSQNIKRLGTRDSKQAGQTKTHPAAPAHATGAADTSAPH